MKPTLVEEPIEFKSMDELLKDKIFASIHDLIETHWKQIRDFESEDRKSTFGISAEIKNGSPAKFKLRISFAQRVKDEIEGEVDDPNQIKLPFENKREE